jgi:YaiO family outer membrane protein
VTNRRLEGSGPGRRRVVRAARRRGLLRDLGAAVWLVAFLSGAAGAQTAADVAERLPEVIPDGEPAVDHVLEVGVGLGRYDFVGSGENSNFDSQFARYTRSRPWRDAWRFEIGRQHRFEESSLDGGLSYTRYVRRTSFTAGLSSGTGHVLGPEYRLDLSVSRPFSDVIVALGYTRLVSKEANSSDGWGLSLTRWFGHWILSAGHRIDFGQPGDTESSSTSLGLTWYVWRRTYVGFGMSFGEVSYLLTGPGAPLVDYYAHDYNLTLSRYLDDRSGINVRLDHGRTSFYDIDGVTLSFFQEW